MRWMLAILSLATGAVLLSPACPEDSAFMRCMEQARAYYRAVSQYPELAIGIDAEFVAQEHCSRSPDMFDDVGALR